jgi:transcriptional regulator with XRE-family HTH domain
MNFQYPMNNNTPHNTPAPLNVTLRRRREELSLSQAEIAQALGLTPECIGQWECGRRRMTLDKIPRIANILELNAKHLCAKALAEFHPRFYAVLFASEQASTEVTH